MARYRQKDETDLRWNDIRRRITLALDAEVRAVREHFLNQLLTTAWDEFAKSLESGESFVVEREVSAWVKEAMEKTLERPVQSLDLSSMSRETEK